MFISAGYDAHHDDPLADLELTSSDYGWMASRLTEVHPAERTVVVLRVVTTWLRWKSRRWQRCWVFPGWPIRRSQRVFHPIERGSRLMTPLSRSPVIGASNHSTPDGPGR